MKLYRCLRCDIQTTSPVCDGCGERCIPVPFKEPPCPLSLRQSVRYKNAPLYVPREYWDVPAPKLLPFR